MDPRTHYSPTRYGQTYATEITDHITSPRGHHTQKYVVTFRIQIPTIMGQDIGVYGDIPELGNWDPKKCLKLKWFKDHIWESEVPLVTTHPYFKYKYVYYHPETIIEDGMDRLAELRLLPEIKSEGACVDHHHTHAHDHHSGYNTKKVELNDEWETFKMTFQVFHPNDVTMRLSGSRAELGEWEKGTGQHVCHRPNNAHKWMINQYGTHMKPFEKTVKMHHSRQTTINEGIFFSYHYSLGNSGHEYNERTHNRKVRILDPSNYSGQHQKDASQYDTSDVYIINGHVEKCDGNYIPNFNMSRIEGQNIWTGPYLGTIHEMQNLRANKITSVLNLMSISQMADRGIDWTHQQAELRGEGIHHIVHCPVDMNSDRNNEHVFEAAQRLNDLVNHKHTRVFVQSQSGLSAAPTVLHAYLTLFKRVNDWECLSKTSQFVKSQI